MAKKIFGDPAAETAVAGRVKEGVKLSKPNTIDKSDDPLASQKMSPTGKSGKAGKKGNFSKIAIKSALSGLK